MQEFTITANHFLNRSIRSFYHTNYVGYNKPGNPDYINKLKNTFNSENIQVLRDAEETLKVVLRDDLAAIKRMLNLPSLTICVIPRAKAENSYGVKQLLFKSAVCETAQQLGYKDGGQYIVRVKNTKTTHLKYCHYIQNDGRLPYKGITNDTCLFSSEIAGKDILLVDDIYTLTVNIDEDCIQALLDRGARSVTFYAVSKTVSHQ